MDQSMTHGGYVRQDPGDRYSVVFLNKHALDINDIRSIFGEFGDVKYVKQTGDEQGYRFVRYLTEAEAKRAVDGLKGHAQIELCPHRPRSKSASNGRENNDNGNGKKKRITFDARNGGNKKHGMKRRTSVGSVSSNDSSSASSAEHVSKRSVKRGYRGEMGAEDEEEPEVDEEVPGLVEERRAAEVVIGNIPEEYGEGYMLHLLESYEPLAIGRIQLDLVSGLRYCRVYFREERQAAKVERRYDWHHLGGKDLVVVRPSKLKAMCEL